MPPVEEEKDCKKKPSTMAPFLWGRGQSVNQLPVVLVWLKKATRARKPPHRHGCLFKDGRGLQTAAGVARTGGKGRKTVLV